MKFIFVDRVIGNETKEVCINCDHIICMGAVGNNTEICLAPDSSIMCSQSIEEIIASIDGSDDI